MDQIHNVVSRVLCVSWKESTEGAIFLPQTAANSLEHELVDVTDIANQALMEVLCMFSRGEDPLREITSDAPSDREDSPHSQASPLLSPVVTLPSCPVPTLPLPAAGKSQQPKSLVYLLDCYSRVAVEERNHPKVKYHPDFILRHSFTSTYSLSEIQHPAALRSSLSFTRSVCSARESSSTRIDRHVPKRDSANAARLASLPSTVAEFAARFPSRIGGQDSLEPPYLHQDIHSATPRAVLGYAAGQPDRQYTSQAYRGSRGTDRDPLRSDRQRSSHM